MDRVFFFVCGRGGLSHPGACDQEVDWGCIRLRLHNTGPGSR